MTKKVYRGRVVNVVQEKVRLGNGHEVTLDIMRHPGAAAIVALNRKREVILILQHRHAAGGLLWEIPAGKRDGEEDHLLCAKRELEEEAGVVATHWTRLTDIFTVPGFCDEKIALFLAEGLTQTRIKHDDDEWIEEIRSVALEEALEWIDDGTLIDAKSCTALLMVERCLRKRRLLEGDKSRAKKLKG